MSHSNERPSRVAPRADRYTTRYSATIAACVDAQARASASEAAGAYLDKLTSAISATGQVQ